jgi:hypothetical protein
LHSSLSSPIFITDYRHTDLGKSPQGNYLVIKAIFHVQPTSNRSNETRRGQEHGAIATRCPYTRRRTERVRSVVLWACLKYDISSAYPHKIRLSLVRFLLSPVLSRMILAKLGKTKQQYAAPSRAGMRDSAGQAM